LWSRDEASLSLGQTLVELYLSTRRYADAHKVLDTQRALWPRQAGLWLKKAAVFDLEKAREKALWARKQALNLDGTDLTSRRLLAQAETGKELLEDFAISTKDAIAAYKASARNEEATSVYVLDAATVEVFPDGSMVDRIHTVQKALDQNGISAVAEVTLPPGAQVLHLRTVKADGTVLEPEAIAEKDSVSLPGVEVGDFVDVEYLFAHASRGPIQPGFTAASFYFQLLGQANAWSTYQVVAPAGTKLGVDAHQMTAPKVETLADGREVFRLALKNLPPFLVEPQSPPSANEYLPFVSVGAGTTGNERLLSAYADAFLDRGQLSPELEQFSRETARGRSEREKVQALYEAVMARVRGRDAGLSASASATLAQGRGSRLWLLKAALEAQGIPARLAAVRTFSVDPASYLFPNEALFPYLCVVVTLSSGETLWLDTATRWAPFGELPENAQGDREAYLLPEPGRPLQAVKTPRQKPGPGKEITLQLQVDAAGNLEGEGVEVFRGYEAASLSEALEAWSEEQRQQAMQGALSRYFRSAELSKLSVELPQKSGAPLLVRYHFRAPGFARVEGKTLTLGPVTFPSQLGRRYVQLSSRKTPLFLDSTEKSRTRVTVTLPKGYRLNEPLPSTKVVGPFGACLRTEKATDARLEIEEDVRLEMARIAPAQYGAFSQFAAEVDLLQSRDLVVTAPEAGR
jgi:hypothetical protein